MAKPAEKSIVSSGAASTNPSYLEWGPVWAGGLLALAISTVLVQFGTGAGLAAADPIRADGTISYGFIVAGLWLLLVSLVSSTAAGYVSGRMRMTMNDSTSDEVEVRDGIHGLTAWALATFATAIIAGITGSITAALAASQPAVTAELSEELQIWAANQSVIIAFATAAGAALGAAAAWFASVTGGKHRDAGTSVHEVVPAMFRRK